MLNKEEKEFAAWNPGAGEWAPPEDQIGDGVTDLNEFYGY